MKKLLVMVLLGALALGACSPSYDQEIDEIVEKENERLAETPNEDNVESIEREDAQIAVYNDGDFIRFDYMIRPDYRASYIYESTDNGYKVIVDEDLREKLENTEPDYTENMEDS